MILLTIQSVADKMVLRSTIKKCHLCLQLSNEMQLSIMNKVKSGELSIEDALNQARRDQKQLLDQKNQAEEVF